MASARQRRILLVTPHQWNVPHPVNDHVAELADGLRDLRASDPEAPDVVVVAPSTDPRARRATRRALRELARGSDAEAVFTMPDLAAGAPGARRSEDPSHDWPLIATSMPAGPASVGLRSNMRLVLERGDIDLVHVHDPLENDLARFVVRRWTGLTVATFHTDVTPTVWGAVAAPLRDRVLDGVDRWLVSGPDQRAQLAALLDPAPVDPGQIASAATMSHAGVGGTGPVIVVGRGDGDDTLVRDLVGDLTPLLAERDEVSLTFLSRWGSYHRPVRPRALRGRMHVTEAPTREQGDAVLAGAGAYIALPGTHPRGREEARAAGLRIVEIDTDPAAQRTPEQLREAVAAALDADPVDTSADAIDPAELARAHRAEYDAVRERIHVNIAPPAASDKSCVIDLHMHTSHSWDCATDPEALLYVARKVGLTAIAVTDHNEISGALACAELADEYGIQVIVGEEVKTSQGEVIGLFLTERIEPGLSWVETIAAIRAQDGLVYVPHPFDRLHTIPDVHLLRETIDDIDAFETYNGRLAFEQYNRDAERFARKYNLIEGAGSDAHVVQGLGTAAVHMPAWDDKESFLVSLAQGEIHKRPKSLLYLQSLKWVNDLTGKSKLLPDEAVGGRRH